MWWGDGLVVSWWLVGGQLVVDITLRSAKLVAGIMVVGTCG